MRTLVRDDFRRADVNPLAYPWSDSVGADLNLVDYGVDGTAGSDCSMIYRGVLPDDRQWAEAKITFISLGYFRGPLVRGSQSDWVYLDAYSNTHYSIEWYNGGSWTQIGPNSSNAPALNDVIRLEADGDRFRAYCNNVLMIEGTNSSAPSSGYCGLYVYATHATSIITDFACGNIDGFDHPPTEQPRFVPTAPNGGWILNRPPLDVPFELNRNSPQAQGLVSWWTSFAGGTIFRDLIGNYNGTLEGGTQNPTWTPGEMGNAPYFDGDDDRFLIGSIPSQHPLSLYQVDNATVFCRLWWDGTGDDWQRIIDKSTGGDGADGWAIQISPTTQTNSIHVAVDGLSYFSMANIAPVKQWFDLAVTFGEETVWYFFINGIQQDYDTNTGKSFSGTTANMRIGTWNHTTGREFKGYISDLRVYNYRVPDNVIFQMSNSATRWQLYAPVLKRYYHIPTPHKTRRFSIT